MAHASSTARLTLLSNPALSLLHGTPILDANEHGSRIRARAAFTVSANDVFTVWTSGDAWEGWMRLKSRSRATFTACTGGAFRLEVAESPLIHVITGEVIEIGYDRLSLSWSHYGISEVSSIVSVTLRDLDHGSAMVFVHDHIASRREASWLMRFWSTALGRLGDTLLPQPCPSPHHPARDSSPVS